MRVRYFLLGFLVLTLLTLTPSLADEYEIYQTIPSLTECFNSTHSAWSWLVLNVSDTSQWITLSKRVHCPFDCLNLTGACNPDPFDLSETGTLYFLFPFISFVLLYFANMLKKEDWPLHMYLMVVAIVFILLPLGLLANPLTPIAPLYQLMIATLIILVTYYLLRVFVISYKQMGGQE